MKAVLDASAALKWQFHDEEWTQGAMLLLGDFVEGKIDLIAPTLFTYEILSGIRVAINRKRLGERDGYAALMNIISLGIGLRSFDDLIEPTFHLSGNYGLSAYDCAYMALAEKEKCFFFTGDKKLFNAIQKQFTWIKWVGDYKK